MDYITVQFGGDGEIDITARTDGARINVSAPVNQIQALLPAATMIAVRDRMAAFLDATSAPELRRIS